LGQSVASLARAVGPILGSSIFAWSLSSHLSFPLNYHFMYIVLSLVALLGFYVSLKIPESINYSDGYEPPKDDQSSNEELAIKENKQ